MQYEPKSPPHVGLSFGFHFFPNDDLLNKHNGNPLITKFLSYFTTRAPTVVILDVSDVFSDRQTVSDCVSPKYMLAADEI